MYLNTNNLCIFEGRIATDLTVKTIQAGNNSFNKVSFSLALDKGLTSAKKAEYKNSGKPTADFAWIVATGPKGDFINKYFSKGDAIKIIAAFQTYSVEDKENQGKNKTMSHFEVVDATFCLGKGGDFTNNNGGNKNNGNNSSNDDDFILDEDDAPFGSDDLGGLLDL